MSVRRHPHQTDLPGLRDSTCSSTPEVTPPPADDVLADVFQKVRGDLKEAVRLVGDEMVAGLVDCQVSFLRDALRGTVEGKHVWIDVLIATEVLAMRQKGLAAAEARSCLLRVLEALARVIGGAVVPGDRDLTPEEKCRRYEAELSEWGSRGQEVIARVEGRGYAGRRK